MKILLFFIVVITFIFAQDGAQKAEMWKNMYKRAKNIDERIEIIKKINDSPDREAEDLISGVLTEAAIQTPPVEFIARMKWDEHTRLAMSAAAAVKSRKSCAALYTLYERITIPEFQMFSLIALGRCSGDEYGKKLAEVLVNANASKRVNKNPDEFILYGILDALGNLKPQEGLKPLFYASHLGYGQRLEIKARNALKRYTIDPVDVFIDIIVNDDDIFFKQAALNFFRKEYSANPGAGKLARAAMQTGAYLNPKIDPAIFAKHTEFRETAANLISQIKAKEPEIPGLLKAMWDLDRDIGPRLIVVEALKNISTPLSSSILVKFLQYYNKITEEGYGVNQQEKRLVQSLVTAIGVIGEPSAFDDINQTANGKYPGNIKEAAGEALKKIRKQ
ncbi:MAG: hypothetical protein A2096_07600 [Spirochaetes bacterium GWF1_41_5]|nr:MAG: hypothetical protein A2096_07600 [Spirochaetes bacterium GWF1_41_5]